MNNYVTKYNVDKNKYITCSCHNGGEANKKELNENFPNAHKISEQTHLLAFSNVLHSHH